MGTNRCYQELITLPTIDARFEYLVLDGVVGELGFNGQRIFNQQFYRSNEWHVARRDAILRDHGHELAMPGDEWLIAGQIYVHHIEPITMEDLRNHSPKLLDLDNLICCSFDMHQAITYHLPIPRPMTMVIRTPNDQCPWRICGQEGAKIQNGIV